MSIASVNAAFSTALGNAGSMLSGVMINLDGGRLQLLSFTLNTAAGQRVTIARMVPNTASLSAAASQMAADFISGALTGL